MKITYILFGTMFLLSTLACSRFDLPRIQEDQSIPQEILTPSPTPTLTINKEEHNNSDSENDINKTENKDMNESTQRDKLKEEISTNLNDLYLDNLFGFSIKYPSNWTIDSTKSVPSIAEIKLSPDNIIGDIYLLYTDGNSSNEDIVDQFITPIKQQPD